MADATCMALFARAVQGMLAVSQENRPIGCEAHTERRSVLLLYGVISIVVLPLIMIGHGIGTAVHVGVGGNVG